MEVNMNSIEEIRNKVVRFVDQKYMVSDDDTVVVATSGGADSMALLMFMDKFKDSMAENLHVVACTVNHGIRGESSIRDMNHVIDTCNELGIKCIAFDASSDGTVIPENASEEWARQLRYSYFKKLPEILNVPERSIKIATAHTMSDVAETVLFRLSRNACYKGLMGIPATRDNFIRPFLCLEREDTEKLCEAFGIAYMTDETNLTDDYCRNKIRHHVIPVLKEINSKAVQHLAELAEFNQTINNYFIGKAQQIESNSNSGVNRYNVYTIVQNEDIVVEAFLNYLIEKNGGQPSKTNVALLLSMIHHGEGCVEISKDLGMFIETSGNEECKKLELVVYKNEPEVEETPIDGEIFDNMKEDGICRSFVVNEKGTFIARVIEWPIEKAAKFVKYFGIRYLSQMTTYENMFESGWRFCKTDMNDHFKPACRDNRRISKLYKEMKIVNKMAQSVPCIKDTNGKVVWLYNVGFTDGVGVLDKNNKPTENLLKSSKPNVFYTVCPY